MIRNMALAFVSILSFLIIGQTHAYDPGFGVYDPNRVCYQAWCYMGREQNSVGSIVTPEFDESPGGVGLGAFFGKNNAQFMETAFEPGRYDVYMAVITNVNGKLVRSEMYAGHATLKDAIVSISYSDDHVLLLKASRKLIVRIFRNQKLYIEASYPLYGFTKSFSHIR